MAIQALIDATAARINMLEVLIGSVRSSDTTSLTWLYKLLDDADEQLNELRGFE